MTDTFHVSDESGDRKYFTIVPNYVLNHSTASTQALYAQLKRLAGENGVAYPGTAFLMKQLGVTRNTLRKEFRYLLGKGWIEYRGEQVVETEGGPQKVKTYRIVDLWKLNAEYYKGGSKKTVPLPKGGSNESPKGGQNSATKKNLGEEEPTDKESSPSAPNVFDLKEILGRWENGKVRRFDILAWYIRKAGLAPRTQKELDNIKGRHVRAAGKLEAYTDEELVSGWKKAESLGKKLDFAPTLDTVLKQLTQ